MIPIINPFPPAFRPALRLLSTALVVGGLGCQGWAWLGQPAPFFLPLVQVALVAHGVEALLGFNLARSRSPVPPRSPWHIAVEVFFTGAIGLMDLAEQPLTVNSSPKGREGL
jgi:hypothetical protein